jgi:hypothetical protein
MMEETANEPRSLILSARIYHALLVVYPSEFRQAYGSPMLQVFRDCCRRVLHESGAPGLLSLWARTMLDTLQTAIEEHVQRGVDMTKEKFIKLSGWALMLGGLALALGFLAGTRPEYNQFNARSLPIDQYANAAASPLMVMSMLLLAVGFIGLFLQYRRQAGSFGQASLGLSALSGVIGALGAIGLSIFDTEPWWSIFFFGMIFEFVGLALFGLANLRQRTMPRWNGLPLLAGIWVPLYVFVGIILEQGSGNWVQMPLVVDLSLFLLTMIGVVAMGYVLQGESPKPTVTSATAV